MRLTLAIYAGLILSSLAYCQDGNDPEYVIMRMVDTGAFEGHDLKVIGRLGDGGAVLLTKILAGRELTSDTIDTALVVIAGAFADPSFVEAVGDRQPRTALLVLKYLIRTNTCRIGTLRHCKRQSRQMYLGTNAGQTGRSLVKIVENVPSV